MRYFIPLFLLLFGLQSFAQDIPDRVFKQMQGNSWKKENAIKKEDLAYIKVIYYGFDGNFHQGELIVNKNVAQEVTDIFDELYHAHFSIEKVRLIDNYQGDDELSMADNNSSAFCTRPITGEKEKYSKHSYGVAIDINPVQNPYVKNENISPEKGKIFIGRHKIRKGMIVKGDACYNAFTKRGWTWGGNWRTLKDYQHFEKDLL